MLIKSLKIEYFRAIKELEIEDLSQINTVIGRAGCGKSSLLESVAIASYILYGIRRNLVLGERCSQSPDMLSYIVSRHAS